jgi:hypothetical protein
MIDSGGANLEQNDLTEGLFWRLSEDFAAME